MKKKYLYAGLSILVLFIFLGTIYVLQKNDETKTSIPAKIYQAITNEKPPVTDDTPVFTYIEVLDSCDHAFVGECVNVRSGPGTEFPVVSKLRTGIVLSVTETITKNGEEWHKINFVHELLYPERIKGDWYVSAQFVNKFTDDGDHALKKGEVASTTKRIVVDVSEQKLYAYDDDKLFMEELISTGLEFTPTPRGKFTIFKMTPSRFMQGPIPGVSEQKYDLPGVPWDLYFTQGGAVIHGAYWHNHFGKQWSHGCVNLPPQKAKELYLWADIGTSVTVRN